MSHFSVAVFTDENITVEDLLEPFCEDIQVEKYVAKTKEDIIRDGKERLKYFKKMYKEYMKDKRAYRRKNFKNIAHLRFIKKVPSMLKWNNERIYKFETRYFDVDELSEDGGIYSTYNPNSKWDWYSIGGRWSDMLILKNNNSNKVVRTNSALVKDIDWDRMKRISWLLLTPYKEYFKDLLWNEEYYKKLYPDEETYVKEAIQFYTYAVLTPDGEWHESGKMGWWGMSMASNEERVKFVNEYYEKFLKNVNPEWRLTIVDCHI